MKNNLKFLTLTLLILLAQSSLAAKYEAGAGSVGHSEKTVAVGLYNEAGNSAEAAEEYNASAVGIGNKTGGKSSSAVGALTYVSGEGSGAFGREKWDDTLNGGAGDYAHKIEGTDSWAIGSFNKIAAGSDNNHILGNNVSIAAGITNSVVLGNDSTVSSSNEVSVGSATLKRKITNVADGEVSATSTYAVNGR